MAKKRTFKTVDASSYERRSPKKRENLVYYLPFLNDAENYDIDKEILDVIEATPFNKIQIPLQCNRGITENGDSNRYVTVGHVLTYNKANQQFKVMVHKQFKDIIEEKLAACEDGELVAVVQYSEFNGNLNVITKVCIGIVDYGATNNDEEDTDDYDEDDCNDGSPVE